MRSVRIKIRAELVAEIRPFFRIATFDKCRRLSQKFLSSSFKKMPLFSREIFWYRKNRNSSIVSKILPCTDNFLGIGIHLPSVLLYPLFFLLFLGDSISI